MVYHHSYITPSVLTVRDLLATDIRNEEAGDAVKVLYFLVTCFIYIHNNSDCLFIRSINFSFIRYNCNPILFDSNLARQKLFASRHGDFIAISSST